MLLRLCIHSYLHEERAGYVTKRTPSCMRNLGFTKIISA